MLRREVKYLADQLREERSMHSGGGGRQCYCSASHRSNNNNAHYEDEIKSLKKEIQTFEERFSKEV
jgi:hypothetical protein